MSQAARRHPRLTDLAHEGGRCSIRRRTFQALPNFNATAVRALDVPGAPQAFVHGEAAMVRDLRRHLLLDRGVDKALLSASGYWRAGADDDAWRAVKRDFVDAMARDEQALGVARGCPPSRCDTMRR